MFHICIICKIICHILALLLCSLIQSYDYYQNFTGLFSLLRFSCQPSTRVFSWKLQVPRVKKIVQCCPLALWQLAKDYRNTLTSLIPLQWVAHKHTHMYTLSGFPSHLYFPLFPTGNSYFLSFKTGWGSAYVGVRGQLWCHRGWGGAWWISTGYSHLYSCCCWYCLCWVFVSRMQGGPQQTLAKDHWKLYR